MSGRVRLWGFSGKSVACDIYREMGALIELRKARFQIIRQSLWQSGKRRAAYKQAFDGHPFGIKDLVRIEGKGIVCHKAPLAMGHALPICQELRLNQHFRAVAQRAVAALIEENPLQGIDRKRPEIA